MDFTQDDYRVIGSTVYVDADKTLTAIRELIESISNEAFKREKGEQKGMLEAAEMVRTLFNEMT